MAFLFSGLIINAQSNTDSLTKVKKFQAKAPKTLPFGKEPFQKSKYTTVRWLGMAGVLINSRGTTIMVDEVVVNPERIKIVAPGEPFILKRL